VKLAAPALVLLAVALSGCETSAEKSAKIEKVAKLEAREAAKHKPKGLTITRVSGVAHVTSTAVLHTSEGTAAIVSVHNSSARALRNVPLEITVKASGGAIVYKNTAPGLAATLVSIPLLPAHATSTWVDDQVQASDVATSVSAKVGEGERVNGAMPQLTVTGTHVAEGAIEGSVVNHSPSEQREVVVYAVARQAGKVLAAGRAVVPDAPAGSSTRFQVFPIGAVAGAKLELLAYPGAPG
jgi:hypothetical protein